MQEAFVLLKNVDVLVHLNLNVSDQKFSLLPCQPLTPENTLRETECSCSPCPLLSLYLVIMHMGGRPCCVLHHPLPSLRSLSTEAITWVPEIVPPE